MPIPNIAGPGSRLYVEDDGGDGDLIFAMDYSGDPTLGGGWAAVGGGYTNVNSMSPDFVTLSRIAGGGQGGRDCYRWTWVPNNTEVEGSMGFYSGNTLLTPSNWPAGATMFFSFRFRYLPGSNPPDGPKIIITTSDDQGGDARPILQIQSWDTGYVYRMALGGGGGEHTQTPTPKSFGAGTWERAQWAVTSSTDTTTANGRQRFWLDNNNVEASPTVDWPDILIPRPASHWNTGLPLYYSNLPVGYQAGIEICDYQIRTAFRTMS